ncbi:MAG: NAD(P)(+) transhydrogenase (Re/Si-specific) subunit alpha, partial [Eggerthellaceae bacterium]|nr:NAD(P)(+) transhydrogenase (Re/Si-specific) subunit alpha [Eggerthellaceae bacterium]
MIIGVPNEFDQGQTLVAATPDTTTKLIKLGYDVWVQMGAGIAAHYLDEDYEAAGASIVDGTRVWQADIVICLDAPRADQIAQMKPGALLMSRLNPGAHPEFIELCEKQGITALALDMVPRISRAQSMDVRSSMANVSGYRAVIEAASHFGRLLGGQVTAAGKINPAKLYVIGV